MRWGDRVVVELHLCDVTCSEETSHACENMDSLQPLQNLAAADQCCETCRMRSTVAGAEAESQGSLSGIAGDEWLAISKTTRAAEDEIRNKERWYNVERTRGLNSEVDVEAQTRLFFVKSG